MRRKLLLLPVLALAAGMSALAVPAGAQCRLCDTPTTTRQEGSGDGPVSLEIEASLDFDRLILLGAGEGTATLLPNGQRSVSGVVSDLSGRAMVGSAVVHGEAGRAVRIELPARIELVDTNGKRVASTQTDFDGFFLFERVPYGDYFIRMSKDSAEAAGLARELNVRVSVSAAKSIVRLGSIHVEPPPRVASRE